MHCVAVAARLVLEALVLLRLGVEAGRSGTVVGLLAVLRPAGSLMAVLRLAGRATGGPRRALVKMLGPVVAQGRLEHLALLGVMAGSTTDPTKCSSREHGGRVLAALANPQFLRVNEILSEPTDLGEIESDLGRGNVLGQRVNFVLEAIPLEGLFVLAVEAD